MTSIPHSKPTLGPCELEALASVLASRFVAPGHKARLLGGMLAERYGCGTGLALNSCTSALHLALVAMGVTRGDRIAVPGLTCPSVLNPIAYVGAEPAFVDVRADDHQVDLHALHALHTRTPVKAALVPHRYGHLADVREIAALGIPLIEDFAHGLGASRPSGIAALQGVVGVFSFYGTKMIATGCGGGLVTNDSRIAAAATALSDYYGSAFTDPYVRYNYRMPDLNAAVGIVQLQQLDDFVSRRRAHADRYIDMLEGAADVVAPQDATGSAWYRFVVRVGTRARRDAILAHSRDEGCGIGTIDIVIDPLRRDVEVEISRNEWDVCVSLPIYPQLSPDDQQRIAECVRRAA